ncbi:MAG: SDR family NAD(P)-dependent oxidoreductase [Anaerolineaceae bacterium]|nr:SDR family NAD(P)-dependent oxidoreductase [Anaerolineaceae bacterium]
MSRVILITGASSGIGRATAERLAQRGYTVFGTSRHPEQHTITRFTLLPLDVCDDESVQACIQDVMKQAGRIDVLVNNAGYGLSGAIEEASVDEAKALFETLFFGVLRVTNAVLPIMREQRAGQIINISSLAGILGVPYIGLYSAAKHALEGYSESLRYEVKQFGIHVAIVEPGDINTPLVMQSPAQPIPAYDGIRERVNSLHEANVRNGPSPEWVARKVTTLVERQPARFRHPLGLESWALLAKRFLPERLGEGLMRLYYRMDAPLSQD